MAQHAKIAALTDELIRSILDFDPAVNKQAYKHAKDIASRGMRGHQYARTNQFQVASTFAGLDEKFRVKDRDDLADALQTRLKKLESVTSRFKPDYLGFLLHLSDRPLENTKVEALDLLRPPDPPLPLTWDEILQDDPYSDEDIWKDIDYAAGSSGDEKTPKKRAKATISPPTSVDEDDTYDATTCTVPVNEAVVQELNRLQFWNLAVAEDDAKTVITELQVVRETLFMLAGLQTSLYHLDRQQGTIRVSPRYTFDHARADTAKHLLTEMVTLGRDLFRLRQWTKKSSSLPLVQTFEAAVTTRLVTFDCTLAKLQQDYLTPPEPIAVSLLQLHADVRSISTSLSCLAHMVADIEPRLLVNPFSHLEALFNQVTLAQMTMETEKFKYLACLFFDCLQTYLKPIRRWMQAGELGSNDETFFIFESDSGSDATSLWHDRYVLRRDGQNMLRSPSFLQPATKKIFNTGKSIVFLKELGIRDAGMESSTTESRLDYVAVCGISDEMPISPFSELFQAAFDNWMLSKYSQASAVLRNHLVEEGGLIRTFVLLEILHLGKNGAVFEEFANALFTRMDTGRKGWNDRYVLTEIARSIFGTVMPSSYTEKLVVRSSKAKEATQSVTSLSAVTLDFALPWPIQNIIQRSSIPTYQQVFTFLLQTYRIKFLLQTLRPTRSTQNTSPSTQLARKLQHRLTWFVDIMRSYLTETVIFFTTQEMDMYMEKAEDIDEMAQIHLKYMAKLHERALLSPDLKLIHKAIIEILDLGVLFAKSQAGDSVKATRTSARKKKKSSLWNKHDNSGMAIKEPSSSESDAEEDEDEDEDDHERISSKTPQLSTKASSKNTLPFIDSEVARLLHFITAGLRSVGRVGAEPMWEQLAERLDWTDKKHRV